MSSFQNNENLEEMCLKSIQNNILDQIFLKQILEISKNEYLANLEKSIPSEPVTEENSIDLSIGYVNSKDQFKRKFSFDDTVNDILNFAKVKFRKNSNRCNLFVKEKNLLFDNSLKIKDANINKGDQILLNDEEDFFDY